MDCKASDIDLDHLIDLQINTGRRRRRNHRHDHAEEGSLLARHPFVFEVIAKGAVLGGVIMLHLFFFVAIATMF